MLTTPQGAGAVGHNPISYFKVSDIIAVHAASVGRGARDVRTPQLTARMPDDELWVGEVQDPDGNIVALMEETR